MRCFLIIIFSLVISYDSFSQSDTVVVKDFSKDWMFFESSKKLPLVDKSDFSGNSIHFYLQQNLMERAYLAVYYPSEFSVFLDGKLIQTANRKLFLTPTSLGSSNPKAEVIIYAARLNPYLLKTQALKIVDTSLDPIEEDVVIVNPRSKTIISDFYVVSIVLLLIYFTSMYVYSPRNIAEYFKLERALSPRELDENLLKTRVFTGANIGVYIFICLLLAQLIIITVHLSSIFPERNLFYPQTLIKSLLNWLQLSAILLLGLLLKFILLSIATSLFQLRDFFNSHFYNFIRLSFMLITLISIIIAVLFFGIFKYQDQLYNTFYQLVLLASLPVILIIYLKLMNVSSYKNLHLFSYLCTTELIPYVIILSFGIY